MKRDNDSGGFDQAAQVFWLKIEPAIFPGERVDGRENCVS